MCILVGGSGGLLGQSWESLGSPWGGLRVSGIGLGTVGYLLRWPWGLWTRAWRLLDWFGDGLGTSWGHFGQAWVSIGSRSGSKNIENIMEFRMFREHHISRRFEANPPGMQRFDKLFGALGRLLGACWDDFEASWDCLWELLGLLGAVLRSLGGA